MKIENSKVLVIGGAGFIGSFVVSELLKTKVGKVIIYDNFATFETYDFKPLYDIILEHWILYWIIKTAVTKMTVTVHLRIETR